MIWDHVWLIVLVVMDKNFETLRWGPLVTRQYIDPLITQELYTLGLNSTVPFDTYIYNNLDQETLYSEEQIKHFSTKLTPYINDYVLEHNTYYHRDSYPTSYNWNLDGLWINVMGNNQFREPHIHHNCDISFVIYVKIPIEALKKEGNPISGTTVLTTGQASDNRAKVQNIDTHIIYPYENEMVIFPNNLLHYSVPFENKDTTRITVSGNITLK